jgi:hypothetical protein
MWESQQLFFGLRLVSIIFKEFQHPAMRQPLRRKDSIKTVCRRSLRLEAFLYEVAQNFEVFFSNIQDQNKKKFKTYRT